MGKSDIQFNETSVEGPVLDFLSEKFPDFTDEENLWLVKDIIETIRPFLPKLNAIWVWLHSQSARNSPKSEHKEHDSIGRTIRITFQTLANIDDGYECSLKLQGAIDFKYPPQIKDYFRCEIARVDEADA
jgi:hypothetical protein